MALSIDQGTRVITIPQADLTFVSGALYELNTETFRNSMNDLMDDEEHIWMPDYAVRNAPVTVAGTTFAQTIEIVNGFSVNFENLAYSVRLAQSNNNLFDVESGILVVSALVTVIGQNSAGLVLAGSALTGAQADQLAEIHNDRGLDSGDPKTVTENAAGTSYDEDTTAVSKTVRKVGSVTTITRV